MVHPALPPEPPRRRPAVVLVADANDATGLTGLAAAQRALSAVATRAAPVAAAVGFTRDDGGWTGAALPEPAVRRQIEGACAALPIDAVRVGFIGSDANGRALAEMLVDLAEAAAPSGVPAVLDACLVDRAGAARLPDEAMRVVGDLLTPLARLLVVNAQEAERLTGRPVRSPAAMREAARRLFDRGPKNVLVTGGRVEDHAVDFLYDGSGFVELGCDRRPSGHLLRGVGDGLTAAVAGNLARGLALPEAVDAAKALVTAAIDAAVEVAPRHRPVEPLAAAFEALGLDPAPVEVPEEPEGGAP